MSRSVELWTFRDMIEHLMLDTDDPESERSLSRAVRAIREAYRTLPNEWDWSYFRARERITTVAPATGTVTYDHTGGSSERLLTAVTGTFSSWAARGAVLISDVRYEVDRYIDSTHVTLSTNSNPGADITTATSFTLFQDTYVLPTDFRRIGHIVELSRLYQPRMVTDREWLDFARFNEEPGEPECFYIGGSPDHLNSLVIRFAPAPDGVRNYDLVYVRTPRPLLIENHRLGTITVSSGSAAVTGSSSMFTSDMEGAVFRASASNRPPTGPWGRNPASLQRIVRTYTSASAITLDEVSGATYTAMPYSISDPIDLDITVMGNAFLRLIEALHGTLRGFAPMTNDGGFQQKQRRDERFNRMAEYQQELRKAIETDNRSYQLESALGAGGGSGAPYHYSLRDARVGSISNG